MVERNDLMRRNVHMTTLLRFVLAGFMVARPAVFPLWEHNGLDFGAIARLQIYFSLIVVALELPSGLLGDRLGRKRTLVLAVLTLAAGALAYGSATTFTAFLVAELVLGVGLAIVSGVDQAILYESLRERGEEAAFLKYWGRQRTIDLLIGALFNVLGGYALLIDVRLPFLIAGVIYVLGIPLAYFVTETLTRDDLSETQGAWLRSTVKALRASRRAQWSLAFFALLAAFVGFTITFQQGYFKAANVQLSYYGWITAVFTLIAGITTQLAQPIRRALGLQGTVWLIIACLGGGLCLAGLVATTWGTVWLALLATQKGFGGVVIANELNRELPRATRVTILSAAGVLTRLISAGVMLIINPIGSEAGVPATFLAAGAIFLLCAIPLALLARRWNM